MKWSLNAFTVALHAHAYKVVWIHAACVVVQFFSVLVLQTL